METHTTRFNYIVTIHNKQNLIKGVILGILNSAGPNSCIYLILDGCDKGSELIIDELIQSYPEVKMYKLFANKIHELKAINIGLNMSYKNGAKFNIILQDDVILSDKNLEKKCSTLYHDFPQLGILSFRHGGNISRDQFQDKLSFAFPITNYVQNECGHYPNPRQTLKTGNFTFREVVLKSPICIPFKIISELGVPNEKFAPWDDMAYCYHVSNAGYANGVLAINFLSDASWENTRNKKKEYNLEKVMTKNLNTLRLEHPKLPPLDLLKYNGKQYRIFLT